jgi:hypothetical protein
MLGRTLVLPTRWDEKRGLETAYGPWNCRNEGWGRVWRGRNDQVDLKLGEERGTYELSVLGMLTAGEGMKLALPDSWRGNRWWEDGLRDLGKCVPMGPNGRS